MLLAAVVPHLLQIVHVDPMNLSEKYGKLIVHHFIVCQ